MAAMSVSAMCTTAVGTDVTARRTSNISSAKFGCNTSAFAARVSGSKGAGERGSLVIRMAATKQKKNRDLNMLKGMLENEETLLVAGFRYQGLSVSRDVMRKSLLNNKALRRFLVSNDVFFFFFLPVPFLPPSP